MSLNKFRNELEKIDKSWITAGINKSDLQTLNLSSNGRYQVFVEGIPIECLYLQNKRKTNNRLFVSLGGGGRSGKPYPCFFRWKYLNYFNGDYLAIDDPSYWRNPKVMSVCWYWGKDGAEFYERIGKLLKSVLMTKGLSNEDLYFIGSSGGGSASIKLANMFPGATAIAFSPQFKLSTWKQSITDRFKAEGVDFTKFEKNGLNIDCESQKSRYFIVENLASEEDWLPQFAHFLKAHDISPEVGILKVDSNIWLWNHFSLSEPYPPHSANPEKLEVLLIQAILDGKVDLSQKVGEKDLGWYFSQLLADKWVDRGKILQLTNDQKSQNNGIGQENFELIQNLASRLKLLLPGISRIENDKKRPRSRLYLSGISNSFYYEVSHIAGRYWFRLICKAPSPKLVSLFRDIANQTSSVFVDKVSSESYMYVRKELDLLNISLTVTTFFNASVDLLRQAIENHNTCNEI